MKLLIPILSILTTLNVQVNGQPATVNSSLEPLRTAEPAQFLNVQPMQACSVSEPVRTMQPVDVRVLSDWVPTFEMENQAVVAAAIANDGAIYDVHVLQSCGNAQLDADCVQAVMGASRTCPTNLELGSLDHHKFVFNRNTHSQHKASGIANFLSNHPDARKNCVAFYRIPLDVLKRYPGSFTEDELLADENIGMFTISETSELPDYAVRKLQHIYQAQWTSFFLKNRTVSKKQIQSQRDTLLLDERHPQLKS